jgi:hypothetical protein
VLFLLVCQLVLQSLRFGLWGRGRGMGLVFGGVGPRSWFQPYRCFTCSRKDCREVLQAGFVCCLHIFQFVLQSFHVNLFWSVSRGTLDNMGSGSGVSVHWVWMVPTDYSQVRRLQLASSGWLGAVASRLPARSAVVPFHYSQQPRLRGPFSWPF